MRNDHTAKIEVYEKMDDNTDYYCNKHSFRNEDLEVLSKAEEILYNAAIKLQTGAKKVVEEIKKEQAKQIKKKVVSTVGTKQIN